MATVLWLLDSRYFPSGFTSLFWRAATTDGRKFSIFQMLPSWLGFPNSSVGKEPTCNAGDPGSIPASGSYTGEGIGYPLQYSQASLVAQLVKNLPAMWETWVRSLGWEDPLEKGTTTHSSILVWRIPWTTVHGVAKSWTWLSDFHFHFTFPSCSGIWPIFGIYFVIKFCPTVLGDSFQISENFWKATLGAKFCTRPHQ